MEHLLSWIVQQALGDMARATSSLFLSSHLQPPQVCHGVMQGALLCWEEVVPWCVIWGWIILSPRRNYLKLGKFSPVHNRYSAAFVSVLKLHGTVDENVFKIKNFNGQKQGFNRKKIMSYHTSVHQNSCSCQYQCTCCYRARSGFFSTADSMERDTQATFREKCWKTQCTTSLFS